MPEGKKTFKERWAEANADSDRRAEEKRAKKAEREADERARLKAWCIYRGSTHPVERPKIGCQYRLRLDRAGISIRSLGWGEDLLRIGWGSVEDIEITDKSKMKIKSHVVQASSGGIWSPIGTTAPVAKTSSQHQDWSDVKILTSDGEWLFSVAASPAALNGKLLVSRDKWATAPSGARETAAPPLDPAARLARIAELHAAGLITDDDLQAKKAEIIAEL